MNDMSAAIVPKSDQLNSDDLIAGPRTIRITDVRITAGTEQPVSIYFDGDNGKPWKSCKSMSRVLVAAWGPDAKKYVGRSVTLYREPSVKWAGMEVGGIRISHMSDIERPITMALTATKGSRKPYTVNVLADVSIRPPTVAEYESCASKDALAKLEERRAATWKTLKADQQKPLKAASEAATARLNKSAEFDPAAALQHLKESGDEGTAKAAWAAISDHYDSINEEVPVEMDAAYKFVMESLAK
jgi:hypothetical protein